MYQLGLNLKNCFFNLKKKKKKVRSTEGKKQPPQKMVLKQLDIHMQMSKIQPLHQIKNLTHNVSYLLKKKTIKLLE